MKILASVYQNILDSLPEAPPETGGILGSREGVICAYQFDPGRSGGRGCFYSPDVARLNEVIRNWRQAGLAFSGVVHTHFFGVEGLSDGDVAYSKTILQAMPSGVECLYFPIAVLPGKILVPYLAVRQGKQVILKKDILYII